MSEFENSDQKQNLVLLDSNADLLSAEYDEQNPIMGFVGGLSAALIGAVLWAGITYASNLKIGFMAVGIGYMVGYAVRIFGKGIDPIFAYMGAGLALFGCVFGDLLTSILLIDNETGSALGSSLYLLLSFDSIVALITVIFSPIDLLFYALAMYEGFRFARVNGA
jgi:hypothetical protein